MIWQEGTLEEMSGGFDFRAEKLQAMEKDQRRKTFRLGHDEHAGRDGGA